MAEPGILLNEIIAVSRRWMAEGGREAVVGRWER